MNIREQRYSDKLVRKQILNTPTQKRKDLLNNMKDRPNFLSLKDTM